MNKKTPHAGSQAEAGDSEATGDPTRSLMVIDRLEVGPVRIEDARLVVPYTVFQQREKHATELIYRYEEKVFDSDDCRNLADMIAIQVALNYGLFCRQIILHGSYDRADRNFIRNMMENTSREIYVKKFLEDNPFLTGAAAHLPVIRKKRYTNAEILFAAPPGEPISTLLPWATDRRRHAVLSSGGKDSLLSFGLLREMGWEAHPIFINESGRHWFTALNSYRYFREHIPHTARVWTNADRVFAWMLRLLPFIRRDFAALRSDKYPVRLWTVAVFLFGALPLMRKRGIGRLIIGDEYDSSERRSFQGITHYDGFYDQSIYFDNALSRYFARKKWGVAQFSLLRPLSELLIEKILCQRYPDLQAHQVSCHMTHKDGEKVYPCGKCEKCRRIVGMLLALEADPLHCGYSPSQVEEVKKSILSRGVAQESAGVEHLLYLLSSRNLVALPADKMAALKPHPEIMKLRFDPERSPMDSIPVELRRPLYDLYLSHATGAVKKSGKMWIDYEPLEDSSIEHPYHFEALEKNDSIMPGAAQNSLLGELTWEEAQQRFKEMDLALLPVGAIEQHGPHLPLDTDAFDADYLVRAVVERCTDPRPIILPLISYGVSYHHADFAGTISISPDSLSRIVYDIGMSAAANGITKLIIVNGHGGNDPALNFAAQMINRDARIFVTVDSGESSDVDINVMCTTPNDAHSGEIETSTALATRPHLVKMERARKMIPRFSSRYLNFSSRYGVSWYARTKKISSSGVLGDPTKASAEKGRKMWEIMIDHLLTFVETLKGMSLDEIYQKHY